MDKDEPMAAPAEVLKRGGWQVAFIKLKPWDLSKFGGVSAVTRPLWHAYDGLSEGVEWPVMFCHQVKGGGFIVAFAEKLEDRKAGRYAYSVYKGDDPNVISGAHIRQTTALALANLKAQESGNPLADIN